MHTEQEKDNILQMHIRMRITIKVTNMVMPKADTSGPVEDIKSTNLKMKKKKSKGKRARQQLVLISKISMKELPTFMSLEICSRVSVLL
jgi:hypothetical protein